MSFWSETWRHGKVLPKVLHFAGLAVYEEQARVQAFREFEV